MNDSLIKEIFMNRIYEDLKKEAIEILNGLSCGEINFSQIENNPHIVKVFGDFTLKFDRELFFFKDYYYEASNYNRYIFAEESKEVLYDQVYDQLYQKWSSWDVNNGKEYLPNYKIWEMKDIEEFSRWLKLKLEIIFKDFQSVMNTTYSLLISRQDFYNIFITDWKSSCNGVFGFEFLEEK